MNEAIPSQRAAGVAAMESGLLSEAYRLLLPFAEAGDTEIQGIVGSLMILNLHRYENFKQLNDGAGPILEPATVAEDLAAGTRFLEAASAAGHGASTFNLAGLYVGDFGSESWEVRKAKSAELYALAYAQGFTAFGHITNSEGPGQPYLDIMEKHASDCVSGLNVQTLD